jgi:hypothetical protein
MRYIQYTNDLNKPPVDVAAFVDVIEITGKKSDYVQAGFVDWRTVSKWRRAYVKPVAFKRLPIRTVDIDAIHRRQDNRLIKTSAQISGAVIGCN